MNSAGKQANPTLTSTAWLAADLESAPHVLIPSLTAFDHRLTSVPLQQCLNGSADVIVLANRQRERTAVPAD